MRSPASKRSGTVTQQPARQHTSVNLNQRTNYRPQNQQPNQKRVKCKNCKRTFILDAVYPICPRCGAQYKATPALKVAIIVVAIFLGLGIIGAIGQATGLIKPTTKPTPSPVAAVAALPTEKPSPTPKSVSEPAPEASDVSSLESTTNEAVNDDEFLEEQSSVAEIVEESSEESKQENLVWIPTNGGTKYHSNSSCSNMDNPNQVTVDEAEAQGFTPCGRCH